MKQLSIGRFFSSLKFAYLDEDQSEFGGVDFGVLTVAMMIAALDGVVQPDEMRSFAKLSEKCRVSKGELASRYNAALHSAGYMLLIARSGLTRQALVQAFIDEAEKVLPTGFAGGNAQDIRRALVIWISMGLSDGVFSGIERSAVEAFCKRVVEIMEKRRDCRKNRFWVGLRASLFKKDSSKQSEEDESNWMADAEKAVVSGDLAVIRNFIITGQV